MLDVEGTVISSGVDADYLDFISRFDPVDVVPD